MSKNNICRSLIVYGSCSPGSENHGLVSHLPGTWIKGKILVGDMSTGDTIFPGEDKETEAWVLQFSDCKADMFTPEWDKQEQMLFERWTELDVKMGPGLGRDQRSWWPEGQEPIPGKNGQQVVNIYLPVRNFSHLENPLDTPAPGEDDVKKLWLQQLKGEKKYEDDLFIALIKDSTLEECKELFGGLPGIQPFIEKLSVFYNDMAYESGYLLKQTETGFYLYAIPKPEHEISSAEAEALVKKNLEQKSVILKKEEYESEAGLLENLDFKFENVPETDMEDYEAANAFEQANDLVSESSYNLNDHWKYCLAEACYGIAATNVITGYLMSSFYDIEYDFEVPYQLWKGGWEYEVHENTCYVYKKSA